MNLELQPRIDANRNLMGISNTLVRGFPPLTHVKEDLSEILTGVQELVYVPYAYGNMDKIIDILTPTFKEMGVKTIRSPHQFPNHETEVIQDAEAIFIGGGNTGRLVANLWALRNHDGSLVDQRLDASENSIVDSIREKAAKGVAVIGLTGGNGSKLKDLADLAIMVPSNDKARIQEAHITIGHIICLLVEKGLCDNPSSISR